MRRTTLMLDGALLEEATRTLGVKTYSAAVNLALAEAIRMQRIRSLPRFFGQPLRAANPAELREDAAPARRQSRNKRGSRPRAGQALSTAPLHQS